MSSFGKPLSIRELSALMQRHGILCSSAEDEKLLESRLSAVGYYRLEEYTWPFRRLDPSAPGHRTSQFKQPMSFAPIWGTYLFDRRLRLILIDAIERFEVAMRNMIAQVLVESAGDYAPLKQPSLLPGFQVMAPGHVTRGNKWLQKVNESYRSNNTPRIVHCKEEYGIQDVEDLPFWITVELLTFGELKTLYENLAPQLKRQLAVVYNVPETFLDSTFVLLHQVRNKCAHHARIWNISWRKANPRAASKEVPLVSL